MPYIKRTIGFNPTTFPLVGRMAVRRGESISEYVRTAADARMMFDLYNYEPDHARAWLELYDCAARVWQYTGGDGAD